MRIADVMTRDVELVSPDATVQEAATKMAEYDVGAVLVGANGALEGILTDRDVLLRAVVDGRDTTRLRVREIMSSTLFACREDDSVEDAFREMSERQVRRLPVLDRDDRLIGIVTLSDLGRLDRDPRRTSETLRELAEPHRRRSSEAEPDQADESR
ncbi:MAG TPA: CBS domain-containing protein [Gammaproteobacteria bacterium]